jgi:hypothetical protein
MSRRPLNINNFLVIEWMKSDGNLYSFTFESGFKNHSCFGDSQKNEWFSFYFLACEIFLNIGNSNYFWERL